MTVTFRIMGLATLIVIMSSISSHSWGAIPYALRSNLIREYEFKPQLDFSKGFDATSIQPVESKRVTRSEDVSKIIPANMPETTNGGLVAARILDHSLSNWFNSEAVRNSSFGRTAHEVEKSMEGDVAFGGKKPDSVKHQFKFSMRAAETRADLEYTGLTKAQFTYFIMQDKTNLEFREPVKALNTQLVYNHVATRSESRQIVSVRWDW